MHLALAFLALQNPSLALPHVFSDNMVLQRDQPIPFFGVGVPGSMVRVELAGSSALAKVGADRKWMVRLPAMSSGGPYTATVSSETTQSFQNVMVGEVWVASGQSNMEWPQAAANDYAIALKETDPNIRMLTVTKISTEEPMSDHLGTWQVSSPQTVGSFSAVANSFAHFLYRSLHVPIGIIHTSWGGTPAEAWTSREALASHPNLAKMVSGYMNGMKDYPARRAAYEKAYAEWSAKAFAQDLGNKGFANGWASEDASPQGWHSASLPSPLEKTEGREINGAVWYRRSFDLPATWSGKPLTLSLGAIDDFDVSYVNGHEVGHTDQTTPAWYAAPRVYTVPASLLHAGRNVIAVRVFDSGGPGGFTGPADSLRVFPQDRSGTPIALAGEWQSRVEVAFNPPSEELLRQQPQEPFGPGNPWAPGGLYNGMIAPLIPYGIRGAIWYQGESNAGRAYQYRELFPTMIEDWRKRWGQGEFPFYFVQLANFMDRNEQPMESEWAELREAQSMTLSLPNTGMASAIDIGEAQDIHPKNKREVGRRLALNALAQIYGQRPEFSGPSLGQAMFKDGRAQVFFSHDDGLHTTDGRAPVGFQLAGPDRKWFWADARIEGSSVVLQSSQVPRPVAVRYAWANNPDTNLVNRAGLPANPFRTDDWKGLTYARS